jgi:vitamin B12 transporter
VCLPLAALAADPPTYSEKVVVTAALVPEDETETGSASTVITRQRIEETGAVTVLEALRLVPGLDVVRAGSDGAVTSVFLRGAGSSQALVLVDGVRVNSPYFAGYDFSSLSTANVERIEVVRGPFSSLYGSDAVGGVIQIFTRPAGARPDLSGTIQAGGADTQGGRLFATVGAKDVGVAVSADGFRTDGERENAAWRSKSGSIRVDLRPSERFFASLEGEVRDAEGGIPGPVGAETPRAAGGAREQRLAAPLTWKHADGRETSILLARTHSVPTYSNPDDPYFTASSSDETTLQARAAETWRSARGTLVAFGSWERSEVSSETSGAPTLDGEQARVWAAGVEKSLRFGRGWSTTAGARYDRHSAFGGELSPRATVSRLSADSRWKVRASAGRAFRAPSIADLYYPYSGNESLRPELSTSYEAGVERYVGAGGRAEIAAFWSDYRDLILYDVATSRSENVGRARTRGVEVAGRLPVTRRVSLDAGYTYLEAENLSTGQELPRRPHHRAYVAAVTRPAKELLVTARATFVGDRADFDPLTYQTSRSPSYLRVDLFARGELGRYAPFVRLDNLLDRQYEEADGYPALGRRVVAGLDVRM